MKTAVIVILTGILLAACSGGIAPSTPDAPPQVMVATHTAAPTATLDPFETPQPTATSTPIPTPRPTLAPNAWMDMPPVPDSVSQRVLDVYQLGQSLGNDPQAFSRMGDCDSLPFSFLGDFDEGPDAYNLGEYSYLSEVIDYFQGSYERQGAAARDAFNSATALIPPWGGDAQYQGYIAQCQSGESAMACEVRLNRPSFMLIALGTNDFGQPERFENNMRMIIEYLMSNGVVPVLGTKADNLEMDHEINSIIASLAYEYEIPLWNFWAAVQDLPNQGIRPDDGYHPTHPGFDDGMPNDFSSRNKMTYAFPWRNLTALQVLNLLMRSVNP